MPSDSEPDFIQSKENKHLTGVNSTNLLHIKEDFASFSDISHLKITPGYGKPSVGREEGKSKFTIRPTTAANHQLYHSAKPTNFLRKQQRGAKEKSNIADSDVNSSSYIPKMEGCNSLTRGLYINHLDSGQRD